MPVRSVGLLLTTALRCRSIVSSISKNCIQRTFHSTVSRFLPKNVPYILSDIGEGIVDVTVKEWYVKEGDTVAQFDPVCEVQSDKASVTITSRFDGRVGRLHYEIDQIAKVGAPLLDIIVEDEENSAIPSTPAIEIRVSPVVEVYEEKPIDKALATPAVRRIAKENQVDMKNVKATGKGGRVLKEDILEYLGQIQRDAKSAGITTKLVNEITASEPSSKDRIEKITVMRRAMIRTMSVAWEIPHFTYSDEVDVSTLVSMKPEIKKLEEQNGVKVTYLPFLLKAFSQALLRYPRLNSELDDGCVNLRIYESHNLGVAVDSLDGLIVPNVKNVEKLSIIEIAKELGRLQTLAKQSRLAIKDLQGGTFTVSNIGAIGGTATTPLILPPQVAIVALGKIQKLPRFDDAGGITPADLLTISCSADHRVIDGAYVARFANLFKLYISSPQLLLLL